MSNEQQEHNGQASSSKPSKPRARLGETQVVILPNSDSEDDEEDGEEGQYHDGEVQSAPKSFASDIEDLQLQHLRLKTPTLCDFDLSQYKSLKTICLRQNEISSPIPPEAFQGLENLVELDLYDNRLGPSVEDEELAGCSNVTSLDLSFNNIRHVPNLPSMTKVETLYLVQNKIKAVESGDLDWAKDTLKSLELGGNRIRAIENVEHLIRLEELWLGKNKIRSLECLSTFANLKILSIQSNRITRIENLEGLVNLEELYLSHNGLKKIENLEKNVKLRTLDVGNNMISTIENISHLSALEEFWASYNEIADLRALDTQLAHLEHLETVYLEGNPCQMKDMTGYRRKVILALPQVKQIDAT
ncbi:hypothetical protein BD324DRAFT_579925 [Kockovaella imperatae]|uniref:U2A'/phosphoprotein 32 family A C-terminal domain-containing protein n=1 Tax=Kockovaella imperatae TaxID=4999 RepID=A0A1Y1UIG2_9TREE|nr:hypothetical protein BD324DRAFT_579925 [Kockovaella imperatae]ORX37337.1 hypothetical protein BD324DRAFT_579925 [Kockovaella imperatae]